MTFVTHRISVLTMSKTSAWMTGRRPFALERMTRDVSEFASEVLGAIDESTPR